MNDRSTVEQDPVRDLDAGSAAPYRNWMDPRLDFPGMVPLRKSYIVASSYRCGSTYFCSQLWRTGVLGAPAEYLNIGAGRMLRDVMMSRLHAVSPADYVTKLLARRTSRNGVFGLKAHVQHFEAALDWCPTLLKSLAPVSYIYLNRRDRVAQAVSMARSMQTGLWTSMDAANDRVPRYDACLIQSCLNELQQQRSGWMRWFELNYITPLFVNYEDMLAGPQETVRSVVESLGVESDEPETIYPSPIRRQSDGINADWAARFRLDNRIGRIEV